MRGRREIDASSALVLPGGLDMHVHLSSSEPPEPGVPAWVDDFGSGSRAAIASEFTGWDPSLRALITELETLSLAIAAVFAGLSLALGPWGVLGPGGRSACLAHDEWLVRLGQQFAGGGVLPAGAAGPGWGARY